jgi:hypothetical protein
MYARTSLTPREAKLLVRYFDGADDVVTARLASGFSPHEDHLTSLLCEMLDDNLSALNALPYPLPKLKEDLAADKRAVRAALQIEAKKYPPHIERRLTSSDLGIIIDYRDNFDSKNSFQKGAMFQAKKLYGTKGHQRYSLSDCFDELDPDQLHRMVDVASDGSLNKDPIYPEHSNGDVFHYLFYCPRVEAYDEPSQEEVWHHVIPSGHRLFRYWRHHPMEWFEEGPLFLAEAQHLHEYASDPARHFPGMIVSEIDWLKHEYLGNDDKSQSHHKRKPRTAARDVYQRLWHQTDPLSWFLVYGMLMGRRGSSGKRALELVRGNAEAAAQTDLPVLPRYVMTVRVEVGTQRG